MQFRNKKTLWTFNHMPIELAVDSMLKKVTWNYQKLVIAINQFTWLSIHLNPTAVVQSFLEALLFQSRLYTLSRICLMEAKFSLLVSFANSAPCELTFGWLLRRVSKHPLLNLCIDNIRKLCTGVQEHSSLATRNTNNSKPTIRPH